MANKDSVKPFIFYSGKLSYKSVIGKKGKEYYVEGYISTEDIDLVNDIVTKNCMDSMFSQFEDRTIKLDFEHEAFRGKSELEAEVNKTRIVLGKALSKDRDSKGLKISWRLNPTWKKFDEKGNVVMTFEELWSNVEEGFYDAFSIAYIPTKTISANREGKNVRLLDNVNLLNVALTGNPINPGATMTAVMAKSLEFLKSKEGDNMKKIEIKNKEKKSYDEDGKHIHTDEKPMGEHTHPELENAISRLWDYAYELSEKISNINYDQDESMTLKDKKKRGTKMVKKKDENPDATAPDAKPPEGEATGKEETGDASNASGAEETENTSETEAKGLADLKSVVEGLVKEVKDLKKENADLKAIVEKPLHKSKGAEGKDAKNNQESETKGFKGPLDLVA